MFSMIRYVTIHADIRCLPLPLITYATLYAAIADYFAMPLCHIYALYAADAIDDVDTLLRA